MTHDTADEIRGDVVRTLPTLVSEPERAERVRARCRARLECERRRSGRRAAISLFGRHLLVPALAAGLFALYATDLVSITLHTFNA